MAARLKENTRESVLPYIEAGKFPVVNEAEAELISDWMNQRNLIYAMAD